MNEQELWSLEKHSGRRAFEFLLVLIGVLWIVEHLVPLVWLVPVFFFGLLPSLRYGYRWALCRAGRDNWHFHPSYFVAAIIACTVWGICGILLGLAASV